MRISTLQLHTQAIDSIVDTNRQMLETQQQISSGRRFSTPADDPVAAARAVGLNQELSVRDQYQRNIQIVTGQLGIEDTALSQATDVLQRVRELALSAGNGTLTQADRAAIGTEIAQRLDELVSVMNTRTATGEYVFAGYKGSTQPFVRNTNDGGVSYRGDEGQRRVPIAASSTVAVNDSGKRIFMDVASVSTTFAAAAQPGNASTASMSTGDVVDQAVVDAFYPDKLVVEFNAPSADPQGRPNFTVRRASDGHVVDGLADVVYRAGEPIVAAGMQVRIYGAPAEGDQFVVSTSREQGMATTLAKLADGLKRLGDGDSDRQALQRLIDQSVGNLDNAIDSVSTMRAEIGARLNTADSSNTLHQDVQVVTQKLLSDLQDIDYAEAVSRLNMQTFVLQASQQSYVKISGLSLFNYL